MPDGQVNRKVAELSRDQLNSRLPLYAIADECIEGQGIYLHPDWLLYLIENHGIVRRWVLWNWLGYMQRCNPTVPNLAAKLLPETKRLTLSTDRRLFASVMNSLSAGHRLRRCIYSQEALQPDAFESDHFVPWAFVAHNRIWNLVPTTSEVNSEKSNRVPDRKYVGALAEYHFEFCLSAKRVLTNSEWERRNRRTHCRRLAFAAVRSFI